MIYAISDIHAFLDVLKDTMKAVDLSEDSRLIFLGDYIDYGPQSGETLRYIHDMQDCYGAEKVIALRGNHEEAFLEWLDTYSGPQTGQPDEYGMRPWNDWLDRDVDFGTFRTLVTQEQWEFFDRSLPALSEDSRNIEAARMVLSHNRKLVSWLRGLPYFYETERQIFVHAGVDEEAGDLWPWATPESTFVGKYPPGTGTFCKDIIAGHAGTCRLAGDPEYHGVYWDRQSHYFVDGSVQAGGRLNVLAWDGDGYWQWDGGWTKELRVERKETSI